MSDLLDLDLIYQAIDTKQLYDQMGLNEDNEVDIDFEKVQDYYWDKPTEFMEDFLDLIPDKKQSEICESVRDYKRTAVRSGQGVGKSAIVSGIVVWWLITRPYAKIIATAPNMTQLNTVLWAEIGKWLDGSILNQFITKTKTKMYMNGYEDTWFAFPKTATTKEGIAGQHAKYLLVICDEASGIDDEILETLLGTISGSENRILFISNPTRNSGVYYDAFHKNADTFNCLHIDSRECVRVDKENIAMIAKAYGEDSNVFKVRVTGDFPTEEDDIFIQLYEVENAIRAKEVDNGVHGVIRIGLDVARHGSDSTILAPNYSGNITKIIKQHGNATTKTVGETIKLAKDERARIKKQYNLEEEPRVIVYIDDIGVGGGVTDQLREQKEMQSLEWLYIVPVNVAKHIDSDYWYDATTYIYAAVKQAIKEDKLSLPDDSEMVSQFTCRKKAMMSDGRTQIEPKKKMKERGLKSPDITDAIALTFWPINLDALFNERKRPHSRR